MNRIQNNKRGKTETVLTGAENTETGNNHPQSPTQNRLPKYGSQSETMIYFSFYFFHHIPSGSEVYIHSISIW